MSQLNWFQKLVEWFIAWIRGEHLEVVIKPKEHNVSKQSVQMYPTKTKRAVMPTVTITSGSDSIELVVVDQNGVKIAVDPAEVTTTLVSDNAAVSITKGVDELHYSASIPAGTQGMANLTASLTYKAGAPGPFSATVQCTLNIPPTPPTPTDLQIIIT